MTSFPTPSAALVETGSHASKPGEVLTRRELFWHNVIREILTALSVMSVQRSSDVYDPQVEHVAQETFDGRLAVITSIGQRIPIKEVHPLFACSVNGSTADRQLSMDVQCSVFQIRTPGGEVHTIPVHEIRTFHALTPELMAQIEAHARAQQGMGSGQNTEPFGFAAFTSMSKSADDLPDQQPPTHPTPPAISPGPIPSEQAWPGHSHTAPAPTHLPDPDNDVQRVDPDRGPDESPVPDDQG